VELTQADTGGRCRVEVGQSVTVVLTETATTGYRWTADVDATMLEQTSDDYTAAAEPRGAAGVRRLTFRARQPGTAKLRVVKRRAWESAPAEEFHIDVDITAS
jgi:predicted secreted protein